MFVVIILVVLAIAIAVGAFCALFGPDEEVEVFGVVTGVIAFVAFAIVGVIGSYNTVGEGQVGIPVTFGQAGEPVGPGVHWKAPWTNIVVMDALDKAITFGDGGGEVDSANGPISAQAKGGGNLVVQMTVQYELDDAKASEVYRNVRTDFVDVYVRPVSRSCIRDVTPNFIPDEVFTSGRRAVATQTLECMQSNLEPKGINVQNVLILEIDPPQTVLDSIDAKVAAEQDLQRASIRREEAAINAQIEAIQALATKNAEQIIACGGTEIDNPDTTPGAAPTIVVPDEECGEQFSQNYLTWLYIQSLSEIDGLTLIAPSLGNDVILNIPSSPAPVD